MTSPFLAPDRDPNAKVGRAKSGATVYGYTIPGGAIVSNGSVTSLAINTDWYAPFTTPTPIIVDRLAFHVLVGGSGNARCGLYNADLDLQPVGAPLMDSGAIDVTGTGVFTYTPGSAVRLPRGRYLTVFNTGVALDVRPAHYYPASAGFDTAGFNNYVATYSVGRTLAAFPTPGTAWTTVGTSTTSGSISIVLMRIATP